MTGPVPRGAGVRIIGLDGLRAVSILLVLFGHGCATLPDPQRYGSMSIFAANASLGVTTFFVVSGFLITYLLRREWEESGKIALRAFYARRVLRIFPALYTYLLAVTLLRAGGWINTTYDDLAVAGTFITNYKHVLPVATNDDYWFVGQFWTLALEEQFYLFWPATVLAFGLAGARKTALAIVLASPFVRVASYFVWPEARAQLGMMLHTAADPIMVGCVAALWLGNPTFERLLGKWFAPRWPLLVTLFLLLVSPWLAARYHGMYVMTVGMSANNIGIAFVVLWIIRNPGSRAAGLLSIPVVRYVGVLSYSLYLWQQMFLTTKNHTWTGEFPVNFVMCFVAAALSYHVVERPFLRLRDRHRRTVPARAPHAEPSSVGSG
jgi:peptidoglycan/LPS O-acetylase OafA/YrhL